MEEFKYKRIKKKIYYTKSLKEGKTSIREPERDQKSSTVFFIGETHLTL